MKDRTNHQSNNNQLTAIHKFDNSTLVVIDSTLTIFAQSIIHINVLAIIHNKIKSTSGSSSRNEHNLVINPLNDILKFQENNATKANKTIIDDLHKIQENNIATQLSSTLTIGNTNKQNAKTTK